MCCFFFELHVISSWKVSVKSLFEFSKVNSWHIALCNIYYFFLWQSAVFCGVYVTCFFVLSRKEVMKVLIFNNDFLLFLKVHIFFNTEVNLIVNLWNWSCEIGLTVRWFNEKGCPFSSHNCCVFFSDIYVASGNR